MATDILRNNLCPCGSGKKFKKCCMNKKPRNICITTDMGRPVEVNGIRVSPSGYFEFLHNGLTLTPENAYHDISFDRIQGQKILSKIPLDPNKLLMDPNFVLQKFDGVFAIDTNTKIINGEIISISCCIVLCVLTYKNNIITAQYAPIHCLEFRNIKQQAENIAWMKSIQLISANPSYNPNLKIGIIVDSDLGNLSEYNNRIKPIYSDFYLPQNIELIYASTDVGKEYIINKLISLCDKEARILLENILSNKVPNDNLNEVSDNPYTHFRLWRPYR